MKNTNYFTKFDNAVMSDGKITHVSEWTPAIEEESCNGNREISLRTKHFTNGKLFLTGEVT